VHRLRRLGHLVQTGVIEGEDAAWLEDVSARDNFFHQLESATFAVGVRFELKAIGQGTEQT